MKLLQERNMKNFFTILLILTTFGNLFSQDPLFSQFYANPVYLNPAMVGIHNQYRATVNHRQQWGKLSGYTTSAFSLDGVLGQSSGLGLQVMNDKQFNNILISSFYNGAFSHRINVSPEAQIGMGIGVGYYQRSFNWQNMTFQDQLDPRYGAIYSTNEHFGDAKVSNIDFSAGMLFISENIIGGIRPIRN
jgi:type IX secretion system PorP/SprF family membrane protein